MICQESLLGVTESIDLVPQRQRKKYGSVADGISHKFFPMNWEAPNILGIDLRCCFASLC
jgi:hypothetical protein